MKTLPAAATILSFLCAGNAAAQSPQCMSDSQCPGETICVLSKCSSPVLGDLFPLTSTPPPGFNRPVIKTSRSDCRRRGGQTELELRRQPEKASESEVLRCVLPSGTKPAEQAASAGTK